jgi:acetyl/propionyl-CoA carboxylase alpha subunit
MRIVHEEKDFGAALVSAAAEAKASFGHDEVLVEKYLVEPRHIEVQVICDAHGNAYHLFERDCSVQRRHQKVVEESPAFALRQETRQKLYDTSIALCERVSYKNAGTIEFIMDKDQYFYFLEMNTRLQVEHPVTELVSGMDLVSLQIDVAEGKKLNINQKELQSRGHALELRLYAEDPFEQYLPTSGLLTSFDFPAWPNVRIDTGFTAGTEVSNRFDPMIAKLIFYGMDRLDCLNLASSYLDQCSVSGFATNLSLLKRIVKDEAFQNIGATTHYLADRADLTEWHSPNQNEQLAAIAAILLAKSSGQASSNTNSTEVLNQGTSSIWINQDVEGFRNV